MAQPSSRWPSGPGPLLLNPGCSPLDPRRCLPSSIPAKTLPVNTVTELLPAGLPLGLGHPADHRTRSSDSAPALPAPGVADSSLPAHAGLRRLYPKRSRFRTQRRLLRLPGCNERMRLRTTLSQVLFSAPFHDFIRRWSLVSPFSPAAVPQTWRLLAL